MFHSCPRTELSDMCLAEARLPGRHSVLLCWLQEMEDVPSLTVPSDCQPPSGLKMWVPRFRSYLHICSTLVRGLSQVTFWNPDPELFACNTDNIMFAFVWSTTVHNKWSQEDLRSFSQGRCKLNCSLTWQHVLSVTAGPSFALPRKNTATQGWVCTAFALVVSWQRLSTSCEALIALN